MSEKYEVFCWYEDKKGNVSVMDKSQGVSIMDLNKAEDTELVCRLLNENEHRKSLPKIDKIIKGDILVRPENLRVDAHCYEMQHGFSNGRFSSIEFVNAIKLIKLLEADENGK